MSIPIKDYGTVEGLTVDTTCRKPIKDDGTSEGITFSGHRLRMTVAENSMY